MTAVLRWRREAVNKALNTQEKIELITSNFCKFLQEKNKRYGDSALSPVKVFSKLSAEESIKVRLDDKISRIINSDKIRKNDVCDLYGYITLLLIENNWLEFEDLLD